jgi:endonuclease/exonuclease/phosphatase family metal-dependent hydrolase
MTVMKRIRKRAGRLMPSKHSEAEHREITTPHLALVRAPSRARAPRRLSGRLWAATYNVHRWTGLNGHSRPDPARVAGVIGELKADLIALQEVLRPAEGNDPLVGLSEVLGLHMAFAVTRLHRRGQIGNAIFSRWPLRTVSILDLTLTRMEKRAAVAIRLDDGELELDVVSTHLALSDRTRRRQVEALLGHPLRRERPTLILGDMNAWRRSRATRMLEWELGSHNNRQWPASFPAIRPLLALDRIYSRGLRILDVSAHRSAAARRASDHLPVLAHIEIPRPKPSDTAELRRRKEFSVT